MLPPDPSEPIVKPFLYAVSFALLPLVAPAADLGCLTPEMLAKGIAVKVPEGPPFTLMVDGSGATLTWQLSQMRMVSQFGRGGVAIVVEDGTFNGTVPDGIVGGPAGTVTHDTFRYSYPPRARPGAGWEGRVGYRHDFDSASTGPQPTLEAKLDASYSFQAEKVVKISGCDYRIIPVEMQLSATDPEDGAVYTVQKRRLIHFPDQGFSVVTKAGPDNDVAIELTWGIVGFAPLP